MKTKNKELLRPSDVFWHFLILGLVGFIITALYSTSLSNEFVDWDDIAYITQNQANLSQDLGESLEMIFTTDLHTANYHPITMLVILLEYKLFGPNPFWFHFMSLLFHIANCFLLYFVILKLLPKNPFLTPERRWVIAGFSSLIHGIHPMHVESVAWASEQKDLLYFFFFLVSILCYLRYRENKKTKTYIVSLLFFTLSILSKAMAAPLPIVLIIIDYFKSRKIDRWMIVEKIPYFIISIAAGIYAMHTQQVSAGSAADFYQTPFQTLLSVSYGLTTYLWKFLFPINLTAFYTHERFSVAYIITPIAILLLFGWSIWKGKRIIASIVAFWLITLVMVLQIIPVGDAVLAERYTYLSYTAFIIAVTTLSVWTWKKYTFPFKILFSIFSIGFGAWLLKTTYQQSLVWKNTETLWGNALKENTENRQALGALGTYLEKKLRVSGVDNNTLTLTKQTLEKLISLPRKESATAKEINAIASAYNTLGLVEMRAHKNSTQGLYYFRKSLENHYNDSLSVILNIGLIYRDIKQIDSAKNFFGLAINLDSQITAGYSYLAPILEQEKDYFGVIRCFDHIIPAEPSVYSYVSRSKAYFALKEYLLAKNDLLQAKKYGDATQNTELDKNIALLDSLLAKH